MAANQCRQSYKMSDNEIKVPNIGEFKNVEVIEVLVSSGQSILKNDPLITIESDKSSIEIPSPNNGKIKSLEVKIGDKVSEGKTILLLDIEGKNEEAVQIKTEELKTQTNKEEKIIKERSTQNLIFKKILGKTLASPKTRKFARELGVNINQISGSERKGRVLDRDIKNYAHSKINKNEELQDKKIKSEYLHSDFGEIEIKDMPRIKKLASTYLVNSWTTIPHVTNHDEADITEMEKFRSSLTDIYTGKKKKLLH